MKKIILIAYIPTTIILWGIYLGSSIRAARGLGDNTLFISGIIILISIIVFFLNYTVFKKTDEVKKAWRVFSFLIGFISVFSILYGISTFIL